MAGEATSWLYRAEEGGSSLSELKEEMKALINDPNMEVKRAAVEILKRNK